MLVAVQVSSMKTSRAGSSSGWLSNHAWRAALTSGRSCSVAWAVFFVGEIARVEETPQRAKPHRQASLIAQPGAHLLQGHVVLLVDQAAQEGFMAVELRGARAALRAGGDRAGRLDRSHPADGGGDPDVEARGRLTAWVAAAASITRSRRSWL
jgi:hypothetical protein